MSSDTDASSKELLSGAELVQLRKKAGRSLPVKKNKEFKPSGSWLEQKQIQSFLDETKALLEEQRVEKQGSLAKAEWNPQFRVAEVINRVGAQWNTMGHERRGKLLLFPEEALFLLEMNKLQVFFEGVPMSIQQAYIVLLGSCNGCSLNEYRTYAHLVKQGYILLRHSKNLHVTRYEQKIRLHQYTLNQKPNKAKPKNVTNVLVNDKDVNSSKNEINKMLEVVDIIEYAPLKPQHTACKEFNFEAVQRVEKDVNLELDDKECPNLSTAEGKQEHESTRSENVTDRLQNKERLRQLLTSQNDNEVDKSDYRNPSTSSTCPQSASIVIPEKERSFYQKSSQIMVELMPVKEGKNAVKKEKPDPPSNVKTVSNSLKPKASEVTADVHSHTNSSDIIILDEDVESSVTNRSRQFSESSSSELGSIKCETPQFKASTKRKFVDDEVEAIADRKSAVSDLDSECEVVEISASTKKKQKQSPRKEMPKNIIHRLIDPTPDVKTEKKIDVTKFQSNGLDWNQPSSSNTMVNNIGKHRITNVQLSDTEIEIVPGIIDIAQQKKLVKEESSNEIEVIDLDDDNDGGDDKEVKTSLSKKEEKMRILDSLPSVEGKFLIHVKAPPQDLLPPNVTPQKKDYYIQLWRLNAAGIGGRPRTVENGEQNNSQGRELESQSESRINPWISRPPEQNRVHRQTEYNTWGTNMHPGANMHPSTNFFVNQNFGASPFNMFQAMWQQFASFFPFMNNPMWNVNSFGMQLPWLQPQMNMWRPPWQNRGRPPWRRPYRGRTRGRFRPHYSRFSVKDYVSSSDAETETRNVEVNESYGTTPVKLEDTKTDDRNNLSESKSNIVKIKSSNLNDSEENMELVILDDNDDDDDEEPVVTSPSAPQHSRNRMRRNKQKRKKRATNTSGRYFKPPKKLQGLMEQLLSETNAEQMLKEEEEEEEEEENDEEEEEEEENAQKAEADKAAETKSQKLGNMKNWKDLKETVNHVMQEIILDSASSEEESEEEIDVTSDLEPHENQVISLVQPEDCISMDTVLSKLQIISSVNVGEDNFCASEKIQKISFDVYLPNTPFRKASPGLPKYRIAVLGFQDHIPPLGELAKMMRQFQDDVPLVFAVVIPDSVTFFQVGSVSLPVEVTFPDII